MAQNPFGDDVPRSWVAEWPDTDFSISAIKFGEIQSGGPPKDGIPSIDKPQFTHIDSVKTIPGTEPVITLTIGGETKVYPLRILTWHEIVNDRIAGVPVAVTYCPLCNAGIVFDARLGDAELTFGTTGKLRNSDLVMYDRQTETWWQQFSGEGIVGQLTGQVLKMLPSRMEAFDLAKARHPDAQVLVAKSTFSRPYGSNPYVGYDTSVRPFLYAGDLPEDINPMMRVVVVDGTAWTLPYLKKRERVTADDLVLSWSAGQNSALDTRYIYKGRDVGNVTVQRKTDSGLKDEIYHVTFAFVFHAFHPEGTLFKD
ncbi:MAG: DUF3179 domain-containing protein [Magnetovibrio sp.]|nr:DUF3179 domain-containing protein [Magnetovibrio sp.]